MNRRQFFGMTAGALLAAGLSEALMPARTLFLPPRFGWRPYDIPRGWIREMQQVVIVPADFHRAYRYDVLARTRSGEELRWGVDYKVSIEHDRPWVDQARGVLERCLQHHDLIPIAPDAGQHFHLPPIPIANSRFV